MHNQHQHLGQQASVPPMPQEPQPMPQNRAPEEPMQPHPEEPMPQWPHDPVQPHPQDPAVAPAKLPNPFGLASLWIALFGIVANCVLPIVVVVSQAPENLGFSGWLINTGSAALGAIGVVLPGRKRKAAIWGIALSVLGFVIPFVALLVLLFWGLSQL